MPTTMLSTGITNSFLLGDVSPHVALDALRMATPMMALNRLNVVESIEDFFPICASGTSTWSLTLLMRPID